MTHYLDEIAEFAVEQTFSGLPQDVVERAQWLLLDSLGVTLAGVSTPRVQALARLYRQGGSSGRSLFVADGLRGDAADAAACNATAACVHILDEGHKYARGHVGTYVLPAVMAVAEEREVDGRELLTAIVVGYEIAARMGMACRVRESMHPSGTWGTLGAAAATARLMGFDAARTRATINVAAPMTLATSWQAATQGATVRDLYSGQGAANAVMAPRWLEAGFTGSNDDVSHVFGHVSSERFDTQVARADLGSRWEILRNYFKIHACCRNFQSGIDVALDLREEHGLRSEDIVAIRADTFAIPARDNVDPQPRNVPAAKESFPVSLALTLVHGRCDSSVFQEAHVAAAEVARLSAATTVACDPELDARAPEERPSRITLQLRDGRSVSGYAAVALGDPARPLAPATLEAKFDAAAAAQLGERQAAALKQAVWALREGPPLDAMTGLLQPPAPGRPIPREKAA